MLEGEMEYSRDECTAPANLCACSWHIGITPEHAQFCAAVDKGMTGIADLSYFKLASIEMDVKGHNRKNT